MKQLIIKDIIREVKFVLKNLSDSFTDTELAELKEAHADLLKIDEKSKKGIIVQDREIYIIVIKIVLLLSKS